MSFTFKNFYCRFYQTVFQTNTTECVFQGHEKVGSQVFIAGNYRPINSTQMHSNIVQIKAYFSIVKFSGQLKRKFVIRTFISPEFSYLQSLVFNPRRIF